MLSGYPIIFKVGRTAEGEFPCAKCDFCPHQQTIAVIKILVHVHQVGIFKKEVEVFFLIVVSRQQHFNRPVMCLRAVEHPILYTDCKAHHFHIPVYGRVIIRDVNTLKPVPNGQMGIINLLTPLVKSVPLLSICTDDIGILHDEKCACGLNTPYLEIVGRVGLSDIKTCTAGAEDLLKEMKI